jgi:hypothetical protein
MPLFSRPVARDQEALSTGLLTLTGIFSVGEGHLFHRGSTVQFVRDALVDALLSRSVETQTYLEIGQQIETGSDNQQNVQSALLALIEN